MDVNALAADGTVALDWWQISHDGKYVAYGTSPSGSEKSTLRIVETATGKLLPDIIEQTRGASVAWKLDDSGFYYTRYPNKGDVPAEKRTTTAACIYHTLGGDAAKDPLIFAPKDPQDWPNVALSNDGRWLDHRFPAGLDQERDLPAGPGGQHGARHGCCRQELPLQRRRVQRRACTSSPMRTRRTTRCWSRPRKRPTRTTGGR